MISEGYICVQPVTFWWPVRYFNHWTTWTKMISEGYICVQPVTFWWPVRYSNYWTTWTTMMSEGYISGVVAEGKGGSLLPGKISSPNGKAVSHSFHIINYSANREPKLGAARLHQLHVAFPALTKLYLILLTLPVGSTNCERIFSKLKIIKNWLRQTMNQERWEALLLLSFFLSIERDLIDTIDSDIIIDTFSKSKLLRSLLIL